MFFNVEVFIYQTLCELLELLKNIGILFGQHSPAYELKYSESCRTAEKIKFSIKDFFSKCDKIPRKKRIWSHLLKKALMENFIFRTSFILNVCLGSEYTSGQYIPVFGSYL